MKHHATIPTVPDLKEFADPLLLRRAAFVLAVFGYPYCGLARALADKATLEEAALAKAVGK